MEIGTPLSLKPKKLMLLGSGELGKEMAIEAQRMGVEIIAVDRYDNAPAMQVAHRKYVIDMTNGKSLLSVIRREAPDVVIPEIEAIDTSALSEVESMGIRVTPNAEAVKIAMDRIGLRRFAAEKVGVPTTAYRFVESPEEAVSACKDVGLPCLIKPQMSSSGHGHVLVRDPSEAGRAYQESISHARGKGKGAIVEEFVKIDTELTVLTYRSLEKGKVTTKTMEPIEHRRSSYYYEESWQPSRVPEQIVNRSREHALKVIQAMGGLGVFGVEIIVTGERVLFNEVSPRPHDTGLVTLATQDISEFQVHIRAGLGLPVPETRVLTAGAAHVILSPNEGWGPIFENVDKALEIPGVQVRLFGKPSTYPHRRMGIVLANGRDVEEALNKVRIASSIITVKNAI